MYPVINHQFFLVEIDKKAQQEKRSKIQSQEKAWLGLKAYHSPDAGGGIVVVSSDDDSPAQAAGFKSGDVIYELDHERLTSFEQLIELIWKKRPGDKVTFTLKNTLLTTGMDYKEVTLSGRVPQLLRDESMNDMVYNLQYGTVRQIGKLAAREFPEARVGDVLLFNHKVEYKERTTGDRFFHDQHLIQVLENGNELRIVNYHHECYGVVQLDGEAPQLIPYKRTIFAHQNMRQSSILYVDGLYLPDAWEISLQENEAKLEELKDQITEISTSTILSAKTSDHNYDRKAEIFRRMEEINRERGRITKEMNKTRLMDCTVLYCNEATKKDLQLPELAAGDTLIVRYDTLYPLDFGGAHFTLIHADYIEAFIKNPDMKKEATKQKPVLRPMYNKVAVRPDVPPKKTESGLWIPDTAEQVSTVGDVIAAGPGSQEYPMLPKAGDRVLFAGRAGTVFEWQGEKLLLLSAVTDIIAII